MHIPQTEGSRRFPFCRSLHLTLCAGAVLAGKVDEVRGPLGVKNPENGAVAVPKAMRRFTEEVLSLGLSVLGIADKVLTRSFFQTFSEYAITSTVWNGM